MASLEPIRRRWAAWLEWLAFWTLLGAAFGTQVFLAGQRLSSHPYSWGASVRASLPDWYVWGVLALLVARLKQRVPIDRIAWGYQFGFHVAASLLLALVHFGVVLFLQWGLPTLLGEPAPKLDGYLSAFAARYLWNVVVYWVILAVVHSLAYHRDLEQRRAALADLEARVAAKRPGDRLLVEQDGRRTFVKASEVDWIEAARNYVRLHVGDRTHVLRSTLSALEQRLDAGQFRRISRSALVNVDRVREIQPWFHGDAVMILHSGARLTLSRRFRHNVVDAER